MELVPILSTIILVGTIATFILAVFAYILYKVRERRTRDAGQQRQYVEARRQQQHLAGAGHQAGAPLGQPSQASMYIAPTTTLPPQGPVVEVDDAHEAAPPSGGWSQPPSLERAAAAPPMYEHEGDGRRRQPQRVARPQPAFEPAEVAPRRRIEESREPSSLFWEYTDEGFVPVDPTKAPAHPEQRREYRSQEEDEGSAWL